MVSRKNMLLDFASECEIRNVQEDQVGSKLNGMHQLVICADLLNLFGVNVNCTKKSTKALIGANKIVGLKVNTVKTKYETCVNVS
jgi:hypothetical protein